MVDLTTEKTTKQKSKILFFLSISSIVLILLIIYLNLKPSGLPVLFYHSVDRGTSSAVGLSDEAFNQQMEYLKKNGFATLSLDEFYNYVNSGNKLPKKSVLITFDDGYSNNFDVAYPILKKYGFKATIFMVTSKINSKNYLSVDQIKALDKDGIEIMSHTLNHEHLNQIAYDNQIRTLKESRKTLESIISRPVEYIAYPYGDYNDITKKAARDSGYKLAFSIDEGYVKNKDDLYSIKRKCIIGDMDNFLGKVEKNKFRMVKYKLRKLVKVSRHKLFKKPMKSQSSRTKTHSNI